MKKKRERDWLPVTVLLLTVLLLVLCLVGFDHHEPDGPDGNGKAAESELSADELQVTFFDVARADAILVDSPATGCSLIQASTTRLMCCWIILRSAASIPWIT